MPDPRKMAVSALKGPQTLTPQDPAHLAVLQRGVDSDRAALSSLFSSMTRKADLSQPSQWNSVQDVIRDPEMVSRLEEVALAPSAGEIRFAKGTGGMLDAIRSLQRPGQTRELVAIPKLRDIIGLEPAEFDRQLTELVLSKQVAIHPHDMPFGMSEVERSKLFSIPDPLNTYHKGRTYFIGVVPKEYPKPPKIGG